MKYTEFENKPDIPEIQSGVINFWKDNNVFEKSVNKNKRNEVVFYDGPPFPTGKPHHGTMLVSFIKDMIARYWTMKGYSVPRVWGWDCHGLPIENQAEKMLGIKDKNVIEKELGIENFNNKCYEIVSNNNEAWKDYVEQMARWVDYDGAYRTMNVDFMESVMWAFKQCYNKGLIYKDYRVTPYCPHCQTSLSISDTRESDSTRPRTDRWIIAKFETHVELNSKKVSFLAWTTTPWTLPSNMALAVGSDLDYVFVDVGSEVYIVGEDAVSKYNKIFKEDSKVLKKCKGKELVGMDYEPVFSYFKDKKAEGAFRVIAADYVVAGDGVGVVHTAPAFGEDDYWACKKNHIPLVNPVDAKGCYTEEITDFYDKECKKNVIEMNSEVIKFLYKTGKAVDDGTLVHNYPHCWRCKQPLIYKAMDAWYFSIDKVKERLIALNEQVNWVPETVKHGRFGEWLNNARDWNISRNRYWSTPIPIWVCDKCGERTVVGSIDEIYQKSGIKLTNLHCQYMDKVTFKCDKCGGTMHRVDEVLDCWFESGSVPFAQKHYPFENKEWFESHFPSDFVVEYTGQIRCWFYYLHVLSVALFDKPAYKNCVVHGTVLAKYGRKLSKSSRNYTDPMKLMKEYGTDAFRLYMYQSPAMLMGDMQFDEEGLKDAIQNIILPFWNICKFYVMYANIDNYHPDKVTEPHSENDLDKWMLAKLYDAQHTIEDNMNNYRVNHYVDVLVPLIDDMTNWYIRRSRRRFWAAVDSDDKRCAYETLYYSLVNICKLFAPAAPILSEKIYRNLTGELSVHLSDWPEIPEEYKNDLLLEKVEKIRTVISLGRNIRNKNNIKNRQPLSTLKVILPKSVDKAVIEEFKDIIAEELNVKNVEVLDDVSKIATVSYLPDFNKIRELYPEKIPQIIKAVKSGSFKVSSSSKVTLFINGENSEFDKDILLVKYEAKEGSHLASDKGIVIALSLTITDALKREGTAREIVRKIQDSRKQLDCNIVDHIKISIEGNYPEEWQYYICRETLSEVTEIKDPDLKVTMDGCSNDQFIEIKIKKNSN